MTWKGYSPKSDQWVDLASLVRVIDLFCVCVNVRFCIEGRCNRRYMTCIQMGTDVCMVCHIDPQKYVKRNASVRIKGDPGTHVPLGTLSWGVRRDKE